MIGAVFMIVKIFCAVLVALGVSVAIVLSLDLQKLLTQPETCAILSTKSNGTTHRKGVL